MEDIYKVGEKLMELEEQRKLTIDERAERYAASTHLSEGTYKGDVVTAYCIGAMDQDRLRKQPFLVSFQIDRTDNPVIYRLVLAHSQEEARQIIVKKYEVKNNGSAWGENHKVVNLTFDNIE